MPAKSEKQRRLMETVKHDPKVARETGISREAAKRVLGEGEAKTPRTYRASGESPGKYKKF